MDSVKSDGQTDNSPAGHSACAVCMDSFGRPEVYFHTTINTRDARVCPRCLHLLIHGLSIADARARMGLPTACEGDCASGRA